MTYYPELQEWWHFLKAMKAKGFRESTSDEENKHVRGRGLLPPSSRSYQERGELALIYEPPRRDGIPIEYQNDYRVVVWTTKRRNGGWVSVDSAWVLIVNGRGTRVHTSRAIIRRGPAFLYRLFTKARDARWRVLQRPYHCGRHMHASHRYDRAKDGRIRWKSSLWRCDVHPRSKTHVRGWNDLRRPFPPDAVRRLEREWREHAKANERLLAKGKEPYAALRARMAHQWRIEEVPQNAEY